MARTESTGCAAELSPWARQRHKGPYSPGPPPIDDARDNGPGHDVPGASRGPSRKHGQHTGGRTPPPVRARCSHWASGGGITRGRSPSRRSASACSTPSSVAGHAPIPSGNSVTPGEWPWGNGSARTCATPSFACHQVRPEPVAGLKLRDQGAVSSGSERQ